MKKVRNRTVNRIIIEYESFRIDVRVSSAKFVQETMLGCGNTAREGRGKIWEKLLMVEQRIARCCEPTEAKYGQI